MAEMNLQKLLSGMAPKLDARKWVYAVLPSDAPAVGGILWFEEAEGTTIVLEEAAAEAVNLDHSPPFALITLTVHSDLEAVGFLAAVTAALAGAGISTNVVAAFHHDHIFVPHDRAEDAMKVLEALMAEAAAEMDD